MYRTRTRSSGFTLVEILIVVIILGILAAIVIPQFTNASQDARRNSLTSQLQTIRSQLSLAALQHRDSLGTASAGFSVNGDWTLLLEKTDDSWATGTATATLGSYFTSAPTNPLNGGTTVLVNTTTTADPTLSGGTASSGASNGDTGWIYYQKTGKIYATTKGGTLLYDETGTTDNSGS
ncbi:MAG TPA: prepilin-type N-terminal cleavage/methylation domain-containing protein [Tepidisphaeraceae bacterium]|jgi:general secretion pathway protein G|nr:prepilin-type N-terminal cleavage/methylation domain-containing protein [Tepidisphaeraceae bacterium]